MPEITIVWKPIANTNTYHEFLLYNDGTNTYYARGGPQTQTSGDSSSVGFGPIITEWGLYRPGTRDWTDSQATFDSWPKQNILLGDTELLNQVWGNLTNTIDLIGQQGTQYNLTEANSNSVIGTALQQNGFDIPDAGWDSGHLAPAADVQLPPFIDEPEIPFIPGHPNPLTRVDPLVVDLNGDGVQLVSLAESNAHFDYGGTGFAPKTGWVAPSDGILIHDINHDVAVTADEVFGSVSGDAFADLTALDTNSDGKIDSSDGVFSDLRVWKDANGNGVGESGELLTLASNYGDTLSISGFNSVNNGRADPARGSCLL